jgi:DNA invertase Pin-like site-specific DNA recombinase
MCLNICQDKYTKILRRDVIVNTTKKFLTANLPNAMLVGRFDVCTQVEGAEGIAMTKPRARQPVDRDLEPGVAYLRMSSEPQEASIEQQRAELAKLAEKHGYKIIREYVDEGGSGSKETEKRTGFLKMIGDSHDREFRAILCWDLRRFGRLDPFKAAAYKDTLRTNGVYLHTCKEGIIKWDRFEEYILDAVYQGAADEYSEALSRGTIRGRLDMLARGEYPNGKVPFGYDKLYVSPEGREIKVKRLEKFPTGEGWKRYLVKNDEEAKVIKFIFREFVDKDTSMREIARQIKAVRPKGDNDLWTKDTVKATLTNKTYAGFAHIGGFRNRRSPKEALNRIGYHEYAGAVPALVSLEDYEVVVAKIAKNKKENRKVHPTKSSPLSGILFCGHCGYALGKHSSSDHRGKRYSYFTCSSAGKKSSTKCKQSKVREDFILPLVIDRLIVEGDMALEQLRSKRPILPQSEQEILPEKIAEGIDKYILSESEPIPLESLLPRLAEVIDKVTQEQPKPTTELERLKQDAEELSTMIEKGTESYLTAPDNLKKMLETKLNEWMQNRDEIVRRQSNLTITGGDISTFANWWTEMRGKLSTGVYVTPGVIVESSKFRQLLKSLGFRVTVHWQPQTVTKKGKTYKSERFTEIEKAIIETSASLPSEHFPTRAATELPDDPPGLSSGEHRIGESTSIVG